MKKRLRAKLQEIKEELRRRRPEPIPQQGKWLRSVLLGHYRYYGVPLNWPALAEFRIQVMRLGTHALSRRGQQSRMTQHGGIAWNTRGCLPWTRGPGRSLHMFVAVLSHDFLRCRCVVWMAAIISWLMPAQTRG
jgi:hypothetical protein